MTIILEALSHEGFGGVEKYREIYRIGSKEFEMDYKRIFSLKYGVGLDDIKVFYK